jgi:hypothetical protein
MKLQISKFYKIDPLKSYTELPLFRITLTTAILLALITTVLIILNSDLQWRVDYVGLNSFVEIFRVPLSIMAIAITIIAILATMHRSAQTREQIIITNTQNVFSNYYKHIEEFEKYFSPIVTISPVTCKNIRLTYEKLFPNSFDGNYSINKSIIKVVEYEYSECIKILKKLNQDESNSIHKLIYDILERIDSVFSILNLSIRLGGKRLNVNGKMIVVPEQMKDYLTELRRISLILVQILSFDHYVLIPISLIEFIDLNLSVVPELNIFTQNKFQKFNVFEKE